MARGAALILLELYLDFLRAEILLLAGGAGLRLEKILGGR
jgi:hypothetical protein